MKNYSLILGAVIIVGLGVLFAGCTQPDSRTLDLESPTSDNESIIQQTHQQPPVEDIELQEQPVKKSNDQSDLKGDSLMISDQKTQNMPAEPIKATQASITTSKGTITVKLYPDEAKNTVQNFLNKAKTGYYKDLTFHRVEDWVIQGGDPLGNGTGGGKMTTELNQIPFKEGSLGVARGMDIQISNDSQFFICTKDCSWLTGQYTNFGEVIEGMDIAKQIEVGDKIIEITYQ